LRHNTQFKDNQHNDTQHKGLICDTRDTRHLAEQICHYSECHILFIVSLNVVMLSIVILSIVILSIIILSIVILNVIMLSVVVLHVIMQSVVMLHVIMQGVIILNVTFYLLFC
jgi:hypothetical protein